MGVSTDAYLFWGFHIGEDEEPWINSMDPDKRDKVCELLGYDVEEIEADKVYAILSGVPAPPLGYEGNEEAHKVFWKAETKANKEAGCKIGSHCHIDYPIYFACISASWTRATRGCPEEITTLEVEPDWEQKLRKFCEVLGFEFQEPKWWLASDWG
jgi:hypothetical protein